MSGHIGRKRSGAESGGGGYYYLVGQWNTIGRAHYTSAQVCEWERDYAFISVLMAVLLFWFDAATAAAATAASGGGGGDGGGGSGVV